MEEEVLLRNFIGEKYDKFVNKKFFIPAFLFGGLYYIYRKVYGLGIIFYILTTLLTSLLPEFINNTFLILILHILISILYAIEFRPIYIKFSKNKIKKILTEHSQIKEDCFQICKNRKKTSFLAVILAIILCIICMQFIVSKFRNNTNTLNEYNSNSDTFTDISNNTSNDTFEYNGILLTKSDITLSEIIKIEIPTIFSEDFLNDTYSYQYEYDTNGEGFLDECTFSLSAIDGYSNSNKLIAAMAKTDSATNTLKKEKINNIEWSTYTQKNHWGTTFHSAATHNGVVFLFKYSIGLDVRGEITDYIEYYNNILHSIEFIN